MLDKEIRKLSVNYLFYYELFWTAEEGIVVGGGCILLRIASKVDAIKGTLAEDKEKKALSCLLNLTAKNAGVYGSVVIESVLSSCNQKNCHNNATDTYKDLFLAVIIDPTKSMLQLWLRHFFMSDCVVVEIKEPESAFPAGKPMDNSETLSMNDPLTAVNNATQVSDRLHQVFTMQSLHRKHQSDFCATTSFLYITRVGCFY
ncbi:unnamed protein product [Brassica napus]|uniref:(rape) hypothetical protein n=1 Tax=Brassica napus TaxID=3708 RepID=A0A816R6A0_BRANA|nr:unnamed protein product [Brassica napus]